MQKGLGFRVCLTRREIPRQALGCVGLQGLDIFKKQGHPVLWNAKAETVVHVKLAAQSDRQEDGPAELFRALALLGLREHGGQGPQRVRVLEV